MRTLLRLLSIVAVLSWSGRAQAQSVSGQAAVADLDSLLHTLESRSAYLHANGYPYAAHLDSLRAAWRDEDSVAVRRIALDLRVLIGQLQDGHSDVELGSGDDFDQGYRALPFPIALLDERVVALDSTLTGVLVRSHPFVAALNGVPVERLLALAGARHRGHGAARYRTRAVRRLRTAGFALDLAGALRGDTLDVTLAAAPASSQPDTTLRLALVRRGPRLFTGLDDAVAATQLRNDTAYLRIGKMYDAEDPVEAYGYDLVRAAMESEVFATSRGLLLDVRGNSGGARDVLRYLLPYFITEPFVYNAAVPRGDTLGLTGRGLFRPDDPRLDAASQAAARAFVEAFRPTWDYPRTDFLDEVFVAVEPDRPTPYDYADRPVVVLMDAGAFSATDIFLGAFAELPNVTLVGTTSAGGSGRSRWFTLAHSEVRVKLSTMASFRPNGELYDGIGVVPDVVVPQTLSDLLGTTDTQLLAGHRLLRERIREREAGR
ncbi:MAG: S41 family peptidase [Bacteroidota bacterium]